MPVFSTYRSGLGCPVQTLFKQSAVFETVQRFGSGQSDQRFHQNHCYFGCVESNGTGKVFRPKALTVERRKGRLTGDTGLIDDFSGDDAFGKHIHCERWRSRVGITLNAAKVSFPSLSCHYCVAHRGKTCNLQTAPHVSGGRIWHKSFALRA